MVWERNSDGGLKKKKQKYKPQDPFARSKPQDDKGKTNRAPKFDRDIVDVAMPRGGMGMGFGGEEAEEGPATKPEDHGKSTRHTKQAKIKRKREEAAAKKAEEGSDDEDEDEEQDAGKKKKKPKTEAEKAPVQREHEHPRAYARRVDAWTEKQLAPVRAKANTDHCREKQAARRLKKKEKVVKKVAKVKADEDGLYKEGEKAKFGDVIERPLILSQNAMKSRSKLKTKLGDSSGGKPGFAAMLLGHKPKPKTELSNYAQQVKDAYALMKARRAEGVGQGVKPSR